MTDVWYAHRCRAQRELAVAGDLRREGVTVLVPTETVIRHARNSRGGTTERHKTLPIVSGYLYCDRPRITHKHSYGPILIPGADRAYPIPDAAMIPLKLAIGRERHEGQRLAPLVVGHVYPMEDGPLAGLPITVVQIRGGRILVEAKMLGSRRQMRVLREQIAA